MELTLGKNNLPLWYRNIRFATMIINMMIMTGLLFYQTHLEGLFADKNSKLSEIRIKNEESKVKKYVVKNTNI